MLLLFDQIPDPDWKPGQGTNHLNKDGLWSASSKVREIDPSKEDKGKICYHFNQVSHDPPMVMVSFAHPVSHISPSHASDGTSEPKGGDNLKGTALNILDTNEFTANIISEPFVEAANYTSLDAPHGLSEWSASGLTPIDSKVVKAPRVGEAAFSMECKLQHHYHVRNDDNILTHTVVLGRIVRFHVREDIIDDETLLIDTSKLRPVSRLGGITYARVTSTFETPRPVYSKVKDEDDFKKAMSDGQAKAKV
ncbi:hypothetical protein OIO90_005083 [Microbotryomycetes sp. JL221]|nr:hypothetical protein OIO90_005083 [Microbotryomycetes sp. JL221]